MCPGPAGAEFPTVSFQPALLANADYSPFVQGYQRAGVIYNAHHLGLQVDASQINFPMDGKRVGTYTTVTRIVAIDPIQSESDLNLINGSALAGPFLVPFMDASIPLSSASEHNTFRT